MSKALWSDNWKLYSLALEQMASGVLLTDKTGKIRFVNKQYLNFVQLGQDQLLGTNIWDTVDFTLMHHVLKSGEKLIKIVNQQDRDLAVLDEMPIYDREEIVGGISVIISSDNRGYNVMFDKLKILEEEVKYYQEKLASKEINNGSFRPFITTNKEMQKTVELAKRAAMFDANVLIQGETGTGKEVLATAIHSESGRKKMPFVKVNCAAIPANLLEAELFGYEGGAFTGARPAGKPGKFELGDNGTIFLDEVGDMPLEMQAKILRVIQDKEIERIGGTTTKKVDVRIISATNKNLEQLVAEKKFREDLYYRLLVIGLFLPPLRDRIEDIDFLSQSILARLSLKYQILKPELRVDALDAIKKYNWPGNIRELENVLERAINIATMGVIGSVHLPESMLVYTGIRPQETLKSLKEVIEEVEQDVVKNTLSYTDGHKAEAAKILGLSRTALYKKLKKYNLD